MSRQFANPLKTLEASTGIEPVYTDLQSSAFHNEINAHNPKKYQNKAGTGREPDTRTKTGRKTKNPGAAATATGAGSNYKAAKLPQRYATTLTERATHYWDRHSNSVQPMAFLAEAWA